MKMKIVTSSAVFHNQVPRVSQVSLLSAASTPVLLLQTHITVVAKFYLVQQVISCLSHLTGGAKRMRNLSILFSEAREARHRAGRRKVMAERASSLTNVTFLPEPSLPEGHIPWVYGCA